MHSRSPFLFLLLAVVAIGVAPVSNAQCIVGSPGAPSLSELANLTPLPANDTVGDDLNEWAIIFLDIAKVNSRTKEPLCDTEELRTVFGARVRLRSAFGGFFGFLHGGSLSFMYATAAILGERGELTPKMAEDLAAMPWDEFISGNCGHETPAKWVRGDDCMDDFTVISEGFAWRSTYRKFAGDDRWDEDRDRALFYVAESLLNFDRSLCLFNKNKPFDAQSGPCNADISELRSGAAVLLPLNHGMENSNYGIGLVATLANTYLALEIGGDPVDHDQDFGGRGEDVNLVYTALWDQGVRTAGPSPNSNNKCEAWAFACYRPAPAAGQDPDCPHATVGVLTEADFASRTRTCFDKDFEPYRITSYPVKEFYKKYVADLSAPNGLFTAGIFDLRGNVADRKDFFGAARYAIYYELAHEWLANPAVRPRFGNFTPQCAPVKATLSGDAEVFAGAPTPLRVEFEGVGPFTLAWSDGHVDQNVHEDPFIRKVAPGRETTYRLVSVTPAGCPAGEVAGSATVKLKRALIFPEDVVAIANTRVTFRARYFGLQSGPIAGAELSFYALGHFMGKGITNEEGEAVVIGFLEDIMPGVRPGVYPGAVEVKFIGDDGVENVSQPATLTVKCEDVTAAPASLHVGDEGGTYKIIIGTGSECPWTPVSDSEWIDVDSSLRTGPGELEVSIEAAAGVTRNGTVKIGGRVIPIRQTGDCSFNFVTHIAYLPAQTTNFTQIEVSTLPHCEWVVTTTTPWININSDFDDGKGSGKVRFTVHPNGDGFRTGKIILRPKNNTALEADVADINQNAPPPETEPVLEEDLSGGGVVQDGQNVVLRIAVSGSPLTYHWFVDGVPIDHNSPTIVADGGGLYPHPGTSKSYRVEVFNSKGRVRSRTITYTNYGDIGRCGVPRLSNSTLGGNAWPSDQDSPDAGTRITMRIVAEPAQDSPSWGPPLKPLKYQWYNGMTGDRRSPLPNGKEDEVSVTPHRTSYYWVEVTDEACGANQSRTAEITVTPRPPRRRRRAVRHSFNSDAKSDLVWHNTATGAAEVWLMDGTNHVETKPVGTDVPPGSQIQSIGDFDGDERPDLVLRNPGSGKNEVWLMNSWTRRGSIPLEERKGGDWSIGAVADLDDDNNHDIIWHNNATGANEIWFQSGTEHAGTWALPANPPGAWGLHGAADFNLDERPDLFFYDRATGASSIWIMNDAERSMALSQSVSGDGSSAPRIAVTAQSMPAMTNLNFVPMVVTDLNDDRYPDIVWRNKVTGENAVWLMNGTTMVETVELEERDDPNWQIGGGGTPGGTGSGPGTRAATSLQVSASNAAFNGATAVTATLTSDNGPVAERAVMFARNGIDVAKLFTDASGTAVAGVSVAGLVAGTHPAAISVRFAGDAQYAPSQASADLVIAQPKPVITWSDPAAIIYGTPLGAAQLNATASVAGTFVYTPAAGAILNAGFNALTVKFTPHDPSLVAVSKSVILVVNPAVATISWPSPANITYGTPLGAAQLNATANAAGAFLYDPPAGTILGVGSHTLQGTFVPSIGRNYTSSPATTTVTVIQGVQTISWTTPAPIVYGQPLTAAQLNATVTTSGSAPAGAVSYAPAIGTILPAGIHTLTVNVAATQFYAAASRSVQLVVNRAAPVITWAAPAPIVYGTPLSAAQLNAQVLVAGPSPAGALTYAPPAGTLLQAGTETLTVFAAATSNYEPATMSVTFEIRKAKPLLAWPQPAPIVYRTALSAAQLNATANVPGAFVYTPSAGTVLQTGIETLAAHFTPGDTRNYEEGGISVTLEIQQATPIVTWAQPAGIVYGTALDAAQLNAAADVPGTFTYTPASGAILNAGAAQTLSVHFDPDDARNFKDAASAVTIDVAKAPQKLAWAAPGPIVYGTPLSPAQLNATVEVVGPAVAGALVYTPGAGTVLHAGTRTLTVTAQETANYLSATLPVTLEVTRKPLTLVVDAQSKLYGSPVPPLTGTLTGVVDNDAITPSYATVATLQSGAGTYPIAATLVDPAGRLFNYDVTITPSTLTVLPAPLQIAANHATKQYSDPIPQLAATFTGLVLGEAPSVLLGTLLIETTATPASAPGSYPIAIGGLTSPNYAIVYIPSTLTVTAEDARVAITSPLLVSAPATKPVTITLTATLKDISASADAGDDVHAGDVRNAALTFIDRATNGVLCTAPVGLIAPSDERIATATCAFTKTFATATSLVVGARIGGHYARDAAADDVTLTIAPPSNDSISGGGSFVASTSAGSLAPDAGSTASLNLNPQYDKDGVVKGKFTLTFARTVDGTLRTYELSASSIDSMAVRRTAAGGVASLIGTGVLVDTLSGAVIDSAAPFTATVTDDGEPARDSIAVTILKKSGGLWLAAGWNGERAIAQTLRNGNLQVHLRK